MNIAFYTYYECCPDFGGTERTTSIVAQSLKEYHSYSVFSIFQVPVDTDFKRCHAFEGVFQYKQGCLNELISFINTHKIKVIVNQGDFKFGILLSNLIEEQHLNCKQIFALHFVPGSLELSNISLKEQYIRLKTNFSIVNLLKLILYPFFRHTMYKKYQKNYKAIEKKADNIILLSEKYISEWNNFVNDSTDKKNKVGFFFIPNAASFNYYAKKGDMASKEKRILIVSRMDEKQKRISLALEIWRQVASKIEFSDWVLDIVGGGADLSLYKDIVKKEGIPRVHFYGHQPPMKYYERSSIFLMTSKFEGFGMTLVEASQYGVVPIVYNTFSSLVDIIKNRQNGFIIEEGNTREYIETLEMLMRNKNLRNQVALDAVNNSLRFNLKRISTKWDLVIKDTLKGKKK